MSFVRTSWAQQSARRHDGHRSIGLAERCKGQSWKGAALDRGNRETQMSEVGHCLGGEEPFEMKDKTNKRWRSASESGGASE